MPSIHESRAQRLAAEATRLLPHLALSLYRCLKQQQPTEPIIRAIENAGRYLDAAEREARGF